MKTLAEKIAVMQHFENGGEIEYVSISKDNWADIVDPSWNWSYFDYRIKEEPREPKYVPFTYEDDLLGLKVEYVNGKKRNMITKQVPSGVYFTNNVSFNYEQLLKYYKFLDGTPCGKLETT